MIDKLAIDGFITPEQAEKLKEVSSTMKILNHVKLILKELSYPSPTLKKLI